MVTPAWFGRFLDLSADRHAVLLAALLDAGITARSVELAGGRFIIATPHDAERDHRYRTKVVTAHYDRVAGSPGALDNSAACLQLWDFFRRTRGAFNTVAIFTDREELSGDPATEQGSHALGQALAGLGLQAPLVFPLDVTGRGDSLVLSTTGSRFCATACPVESGSRLGAEIEAMAETVSRLMSGRARVYRIAVPFGEDLGFILAGIPALTVTVLPRAEAESLVDASPVGLPAWASLDEPGLRSPATWSRIHHPTDTADQYIDDAFDVVAQFLSRLAALRAPAPLRPV